MQRGRPRNAAATAAPLAESRRRRRSSGGTSCRAAHKANRKLEAAQADAVRSEPTSSASGSAARRRPTRGRGCRPADEERRTRQTLAQQLAGRRCASRRSPASRRCVSLRARRARHVAVQRLHQLQAELRLARTEVRDARGRRAPGGAARARTHLRHRRRPRTRAVAGQRPRVAHAADVSARPGRPRGGSGGGGGVAAAAAAVARRRRAAAPWTMASTRPASTSSDRSDLWFSAGRWAPAEGRWWRGRPEQPEHSPPAHHVALSRWARLLSYPPLLEMGQMRSSTRGP